MASGAAVVLLGQLRGFEKQTGFKKLSNTKHNGSKACGRSTVSIFKRSIFSLIRGNFFFYLFDEAVKFKIWLWKIICF